MTPDPERLVRQGPRPHEVPPMPAVPPSTAGPAAAGAASPSVFTIANQLTLLRLLLIPAFVLLVVYGQFGWALVVFGVAGLTDALDGLIARLTGQKSELGAWLDPAADKLLLVTTFVVLTLPNIGLVNRIPIWLTVLIISRDVGIVLTVAIVNLASGPRTFRPSRLGKAATAWFIVTCVIVMLYNWLGTTSPVVDAFIWGSLAITLLSGIDYLWRIGRSLV
jgi:cardiolipin synthase